MQIYQLPTLVTNDLIFPIIRKILQLKNRSFVNRYVSVSNDDGHRVF